MASRLADLAIISEWFIALDALHALICLPEPSNHNFYGRIMTCPGFKPISHQDEAVAVKSAVLSVSPQMAL